MAYIDFYHYTSKAGKDAILEETLINQSAGMSDAAFGPGVYGTTLTPAAGKQRIIENNWTDDLLPALIKKATYAIKIQIPASEVKRAKSNRDILIYVGDLDLDEYEYEVIATGF